MQRSLGILAGVLAVALVGWLIWIAPGGDARRLDASVMGADGLRHWLVAQQVPVVRGTGRSNPMREDLSAAILPLYDTDLTDADPTPETDEERMAQTSPREAEGWLVESMASQLPMLVMLPKWRTGFALTGIAHEQTQVPPDQVQRVVRQLGLGPARLVPVVNDMTAGNVALRDLPADAPPDGGQNSSSDRPLIAPPLAAPDRSASIALFRAQLLDRASLPAHCVELAGLPAGALILHCAETDDWPGVTVLADPDLLNSHGLRLADNAAFAAHLVDVLRAGDTRPVLLATEPLYIRSADEQPAPHRRTGEDLARLFAWPLSALWAMGGVVLGLALWRGLRRFGPARGRPADSADSSHRAAIAAKARLLRLSGADARMAAEHVRGHLADLAVRALGPGAGNDPGIARWFALIARRDAALADDIRATAARITPDTPPADLPRLVQTFHALTRKAQDAA
ncbi:hypothetical protein [Gemmobacter sp.]|uniref:hypothetical protein n=1 Tax=Gemmobacter sp. TaxID=1898957 RepID=UPI002AFF341A|nr:hypothetical protein [Gemmobacter sp.]